MAVIKDPAIVFQAIAKQALNGTVILFLDAARDGITQVTVPVNAFQVAKGVNAIEEYEMVCIHRSGNLFDTVVLEDGFLKTSGWMSSKDESLNVQFLVLHRSPQNVGKAATEKNPTPVQTFWSSFVCVVDGKEYYAMFETRGLPVTMDNVHRFAPMGLYFTNPGKLDDFVMDRVLFVQDNDVAVAKPKGDFVHFSDLGKQAVA